MRMDEETEVERELGSQLGKDLRGHENYINIIGNGSSDRVKIHLPREVRQFDSTKQALEEGFVPYCEPRGWNVDALRAMGLNREKNIVEGYEADLVLDQIDIPERVEGYVASLCRISTARLNEHFNVSAQFYRKKE